MKHRTHYSQTTCRHYPTILLIFYSIQSPVQEARTELATWTNTPAQVFEWKFITEVYVYIIRVVRRIKRFFFSSFPALLKLAMVVVTFAAFFHQILGSRGLPVPSQAFLAYVFSIFAIIHWFKNDSWRKATRTRFRATIWSLTALCPIQPSTCSYKQ